LCNDCFHFGKDAVGKGFLPDFIPEMFHWIEFRRVGRKAVKTDVFRDFELFRNMGTGSNGAKLVGIWDDFAA
jgi:hypothetical protein